MIDSSNKVRIQSNRSWQFLSVRYCPDGAAIAAYESQLQKSWNNGYEEFSLFFEVDPLFSHPIADQNGGLLHVRHLSNQS